MKIDIVSDVVCPWCVIGIRALEQALDALADTVDAEIRLHPFELNPAMPPEGQNIGEHIAEKYGATPAQSAANREAIRERAQALGFTMATGPHSRITNTFDAHRLLHWAQTQGRQLALKHALFEGYFTQGQSTSDVETLVTAAEAVGLDGVEARAVLAEGRFADAVRAEEAHWRAQGISAVPAFIINERYIISGGQPPATFERALREIASAE